jgi:hypothetical protein
VCIVLWGRGVCKLNFNLISHAANACLFLGSGTPLKEIFVRLWFRVSYCVRDV